MNNYQLYSITKWEEKKPEGVEFTHIYLTDKSNEVRKAHGNITVLKKVFANGKRSLVKGIKKARWDGYGRCYVGTHNIRKRDFDIPLRDEQPVTL